jgi:hypothetical protein
MAQQMPNPYGPNINLATAKKVAAAAAEEAAKLKINVVIVVVDTVRPQVVGGTMTTPVGFAALTRWYPLHRLRSSLPL